MASHDVLIKDGPELAVKQLNQRLSGQFPNRRSYHTKVTVLCLYWQADDMGVEKEVDEVEKLFKELFHYEVERYAIPSDDQQMELTKKVLDVFSCHRKPGELLIIYYGGHGLLDDAQGRYGSVWAAKRPSEGGPNLEWHKILKALRGFSSEGYLLQILDCCFAAQAARGRATILAACSMDRETPWVGAQSFTSRLIPQVQELLREYGFVDLRQLHGRLIKRSARLNETPILADLSDNPEVPPLVLEPLVIATSEAGLVETLYTINFTLLVHATSFRVQPVTDWLGTAPRMVKNITCTGFGYHNPPKSILSVVRSMEIPPLGDPPRQQPEFMTIGLGLEDNLGIFRMIREFQKATSPLQSEQRAPLSVPQPGRPLGSDLPCPTANTTKNKDIRDRPSPPAPRDRSCLLTNHNPWSQEV